MLCAIVRSLNCDINWHLGPLVHRAPPDCFRWCEAVKRLSAKYLFGHDSTHKNDSGNEDVTIMRAGMVTCDDSGGLANGTESIRSGNTHTPL